MIIIPDVHGRDFWREAVSKREEGETVVFLGDYCDPYTENEGITQDDAFIEFCAILDYYDRNRDTTILLLGNHDLYYLDRSFRCCRHDDDYQRWNELFQRHRYQFRIAYETEIDNTQYLVSHAGVHKRWLDRLEDIVPKKPEATIADYLNDLYENHWHAFREEVAEYSYFRGFTYSPIGSCVWADVREWSEEENERIPGIFQIFGHSSCKEPMFGDDWAMLDAHCAFRLDNSGTLSKL